MQDTRGRNKPSGVTYTKAAIASDDLYGYIAASKEAQPKAQSILAKYGYDQADTETDLAHKLSSLVMNVGENALKDITMIHPDRELILSFFTPVKKANQQSDESLNDCGCNKKALNDCGCGGHHNDCGCGGKGNAAQTNVVAPTVSLNDSGSPQYFALQESAPIEKFESEVKNVTSHNVYLAPVIVLSASIILATFIWKKL